MTLKLHRPGPQGLEQAPVEEANWRRQLRSRRWRAAKLENPEREPVRPWAAVLAFAALLVLTFVALVGGYGSGFWGP